MMENREPYEQRSTLSVKYRYTTSLEQQIRLLELENHFLMRIMRFSMGRSPAVKSTLTDDKENTGPSERQRRKEQMVEGHDWKKNVNTAQVGSICSCAQEKRCSDMEEDVHLKWIRRLHFLESSLEDMVRAVTAQEQRMSAIKQKLETVETTMHIEEGKWSLMEELLPLQQRLDDLAPAIAAKEARISELSTERDGLISRLCAMNTTVERLQVTIENARLMEHNARLILENQLLHLSKEYEYGDFEQYVGFDAVDRISELRLHMKAYKTQIAILHERLHLAVLQVKHEVGLHALTSSEAIQEHLQTRREVDALQALSESLCFENRSLRGEKLLLADRIEQLESSVISHEGHTPKMDGEPTVEDKGDSRE